MAARDVVALGCAARDDTAAVARALACCDAAAYAHRNVDSLSGGEQARVLLARLLAGDADILLLDEPVDALDPAHRFDIMRVLRAEAAGGRAVLVILHDLTLAARFCDRIVLMKEGRAVVDAPPDAAFTPEMMARIFGIDIVSVSGLVVAAGLHGENA